MRDTGIFILRAGLGSMMLTHGYSKFMKLFSGGEISFYNFLGLGETLTLILAVFSEFICAILIIIGYKTKFASIPLVITMAIAAFMVHADDPFSKKEMALVYLVGFLAIGFFGGGRYSIDGMKRS